MAEARAASDLYHTQKRGLKFGRSEHDGYFSFQVSIPRPVTVARAVKKWASRTKRSTINRLWPLRPIHVLVVMVAVCVMVIRAEETSWVRSGWLAQFLWIVDEYTAGVINPFHRFYPTDLRVGYLAAIAGFIGMCIIVAGERFVLQSLLTWKGWLYLGPGEKSYAVMLWGAGVKIMSGRKSLTYGFQMSLPTLPVPSIKGTCERYLITVRPLLSPPEFERVSKLARDFMANEGPKLQRYLWLKRLFTSNYVTDWWEKYVYLRGRGPLMINSNYYVHDGLEAPTSDQVLRAACLTHHMLEFKDMLESETLEPLTIRGTVPLCMKQYERMFGTCRIPGRESDIHRHKHRSTHIVVVWRGNFYRTEVYDRSGGGKGVPYTVSQLAQAIRTIKDQAREELRAGIVPSAPTTTAAAAAAAAKTSPPASPEDAAQASGTGMLRRPRRKSAGGAARFASRKGGRIQSYEDFAIALQESGESDAAAAAGKAASESSGAKGSPPPKRRSKLPSRQLDELSPRHISAFTAGPRTRWAEVREVFFAEGVNRASLHEIETAAFIMWLEPPSGSGRRGSGSGLSPSVEADETCHSSMVGATERCASLFHGDGGSRWFDKSVNMVVYDDGHAGLNVEHSWADAPAVAHMWEYACLKEVAWHERQRVKALESGAGENGTSGAAPEAAEVVQYNEGEATPMPSQHWPTRLEWNLDRELRGAMWQAKVLAKGIIDDLDLKVIRQCEYGAGFMKKCKMSPDAYLQMALQMAYFRDQGHFDLTYEASMTRLYRNGRTETVRSLSSEAAAFVRAMHAEPVDGEPAPSPVLLVGLLRAAGVRHQQAYRDAMVGRGIDRHLFALYIVSKGVLPEVPGFLAEALSVPWRLSTSQQPQKQTDLRKGLPKHLADAFLSPGGGFGPVADDGYGVSYMVAGNSDVFFHISSKKSAGNSDSSRFSRHLLESLRDLKTLFEDATKQLEASTAASK